MASRTTRFRALLHAPDILQMPGVSDALTARLAERAGFAAAACGGYAATAALLAAPDVSQLSLTELTDHFARIADATDLPLFVDGDTGFGNVSNVKRTARLIEKSGAAGYFIEDQVFPKRCGHMAGKAVIPTGEMVAKLKAALDARVDPDLVIMARTDALAVEGLEAALERAATYEEAGADFIFVEAPRSIAEMRAIVAAVRAPTMANCIEGGLTPFLTAAELEAIGFAAVAYPCSVVFTIAAEVARVLAALRRDGTTESVRAAMLDFDRFNALVGLPALRADEQAKLDAAAAVLAARDAPRPAPE